MRSQPLPLAKSTTGFTFGWFPTWLVDEYAGDMPRQSNATVARYLGVGPYAFLPQNPMAWVGLIQAYLLMAVVAVTLLIVRANQGSRQWHVIGAVAHLAPLLAVIFSWGLLTSLDFGSIAIISLAFHAIWIVLETIMRLMPNQNG